MVANADDRVRGWIRALCLVEAAERASITPIPLQRLHAFAYLADTLSPVWGLQPFDSVALKTERTPYFFAFQDHIDDLVVHGLVKVNNFTYRANVAPEARLSADYTLNFEHDRVDYIVSFLDDQDLFATELNYLTALAVALSRLPDEQIASAAKWDASWEEASDLVELKTLIGTPLRTATDAIVDVFEELKHEKTNLTPAGRLRLYATYLGDRMKAA